MVDHSTLDMKFGEVFHRHSLPEWSRHYIDYNLLKALVKSAAPSDVYGYLDTSISCLDSFFQLQFDSVSCAETELWEFFGFHAEPATVLSVTEMCRTQLQFLLAAFSELQHNLEKLHWFESINTEAITRIFSKLGRYSQADSPVRRKFQAQWDELQRTWETKLLNLLEKMERLIDDINVHLFTTEYIGDRSLFLARTLSRGSHPKLPAGAVQEAVQNGNVDPIIQYLISGHTESDVMESVYADLVQSLLGFSIVSLPAQFDALLTLVPSAQKTRLRWSLCKWYIITIGRRQRPESGPKTESSRKACLDSAGDYAIPAVLETNLLHNPEALWMNDRSGRLLLHYAASYGLLSICQEIVVALGGGSADLHDAVRAILMVDHEGFSPLDHAVIGNHTSTATYLVGIMVPGSTVAGGDTKRVMGNAFLAALRNQNDEVVQCLLRSGVDLGRQFNRGETALYIAAQLGRTDYADLIVRALLGDNAGLDVPEASRGWTPLFVACANGNHDIVALLLRAGSRRETTDYLGWTAKEHAVFRGHLPVAELFGASDFRNLKGGPASTRATKSPYSGLRCREDEKVIIASLGVTRTDRLVTGLSYSSCSSSHTPDSYENLWFTLEVSAPGSTAKPHRLRLPILDDHINDPFIFPIPEASEPRLLFRVIRSSRGSSGGAVVGSGMALLGTNTHQFGTKRQSLIRDQTIPIIDKDTMDMAGTVTFTSLVAKRYPHLQTPRPTRTTANPPGQPILVGHRGAGMNTGNNDHLQVGENTVGSFLTAANLGASFVEFDVQVTRDLEPVTFHDFSLSETGTDVPVHDLTLEQFLHASNIQSPHGNPLSVLGTARSQAGPGKPRSRSVGNQFEAGAIHIRDRMKHTVDFRSKGFKPNTRGDFIQDTFATLKEILVQLPQDIGCDIEIKYPRLHEAVDAGVAPVAIELNSFVDVALDVIHRHGRQRQIILSSFTPEICILLSVKQRAYPVFFITNAGRVPMTDMEVRAANMQVAVRFAQRWNLAGIVFACEALLLCPRLVGFVKAKGLVCASYGVLNNEPEKVKVQVEAGVDLIVADRVGLVAKSLAGALN